MDIGETLARARILAGLAVGDVSARTGIPEGLIRAIELDDFAGCGGDFYARAHIRAIAAAVGTKAKPLIRKYDAAHPSARQVPLEDLPGRPVPGRRRGRGRAAGPAIAVGVALAASGFVAYEVASHTGSTQHLASSQATTHQPGGRARTPSSSGHESTATSLTLSPTAPPVTDVTPVSATAFGPGGTSDGDDPQQASLALSGNLATPWHTDWYATAEFGNLQAGTGLLLDLGRTLTVTGATIQLGSTPGADFQLRAGTTPAGLATVASDFGAGGLVRLRPSSPVRARYLLIWFTLLPPDSAGTYEAYVSDVIATVTP